METRIDLDAAAREVASRADRWRTNGVAVGEITWRDAADKWPHELKTNRADVRDPESIGVRCTKGEQEGYLVLFRGAWSDLEYWSGNVDDEPIEEMPGWTTGSGGSLTLETFGALLDRFAGLFQ